MFVKPSSKSFSHETRNRKRRLLKPAVIIGVVIAISALVMPIANAVAGTNGAVTTAPTGFTSTAVTSRSASFKWDPVTGATAYVLAWGKTPGSQMFRYTTNGSVTSVTIPNLNASLNYYFELWALPNASGGPHTKPMLVTTMAPSVWATNPPTAFTGKAVAGYGVQLSWTGTANATFYTVAWGTSSASVQQNQKTTTATDLTLAPLNSNTTYYFEVWADPTKPGGPHAGPISVTTLSNPQPEGAPSTTNSKGQVIVAPKNFAVTGTSVNSASLQWGAVFGSKSYTVAYGRTAGSQQFKYSVPAGTNPLVTATVPNLIANTRYYFEVWANPAQTGGPHAGPIPATTKSYVTVAPANFHPVNVTKAGKNRNVNLAWNAVPNATSYTVAYNLGTSCTQANKVTANTTRVTVGPIAPGTYCFEVWGDPTKPGVPHSGAIIIVK